MVRIADARPEDARALAEVHVAAWRETYAGLLPDRALDSLSVPERTALWRRVMEGGGWVIAARDGGRIVGFVSGGPARDTDLPAGTGEIMALYLLKAHHGRGHGKALFTAACRRLARDGCRGLALWVLAGNPTRGFYRRRGGTADKAEDDLVAGARVRAVRYVWPHLPG